MAKIQLINVKGEKLKDLTLADNIWNIEVNDIVLKKAIDLHIIIPHSFLDYRVHHHANFFQKSYFDLVSLRRRGKHSPYKVR